MSDVINGRADRKQKILVCLGFMVYQPLYVINAKSSLYIYISNIWLVNTFCRKLFF